MANSASNPFQTHYSLLVAHIQHLDECLGKLTKLDTRIPELRKMRSRAVKVAQDAKRAEDLMSAKDPDMLYFEISSDPVASSEDYRNAQPPLIRTTPPPLLAKRGYEEYDELRSGTPPGKRRRTNILPSSQSSAAYSTLNVQFGLHDIAEETWEKHHQHDPLATKQETVKAAHGGNHFTNDPRILQQRDDQSTFQQMDASSNIHLRDLEQKKKRKHTGGSENTSPAESGQKRLRSSVPV